MILKHLSDYFINLTDTELRELKDKNLSEYWKLKEACDLSEKVIEGTTEEIIKRSLEKLG